MAVEHLFTQELGLSSPWKVVYTVFDPDAPSLELVIDFERVDAAKAARLWLVTPGKDKETGGLPKGAMWVRQSGESQEGASAVARRKLQRAWQNGAIPFHS